VRTAFSGANGDAIVGPDRDEAERFERPSTTVKA
jgi:hypothetical protein